MYTATCRPVDDVQSTAAGLPTTGWQVTAGLTSPGFGWTLPGWVGGCSLEAFVVRSGTFVAAAGWNRSFGPFLASPRTAYPAASNFPNGGAAVRVAAQGAVAGSAWCSQSNCAAGSGLPGSTFAQRNWGSGSSGTPEAGCRRRQTLSWGPG